jgi:uncharacterized membrane protein YfcA
MDVLMALLFILCAYFAEIVGTMAGFGSSTIFLPLALIFVDFRLALVMVAITHISGNTGRITFFRSGLDKKLIIIFGIPSILLTLLGSYLVNYASQEVLKLCLGIFLMIFGLLSLYKSNLQFPANKITAITGGGISGFFAGLIGTGGALRGAFLMGFGLKKEIYIATAATIALMVDFTRLPVYFSQGFIPSNMYFFIPILFLTAILGSYTGKRFLNRIPQIKFRKIVISALILVSIKFIYDGLFYILK